MSRVMLIVIGVITAVIGILTLFPRMTLGLWLSIVLIGLGIVSIILGFLDKRKNLVQEGIKDIKKEEKIENTTE